MQRICLCFPWATVVVGLLLLPCQGFSGGTVSVATESALNSALSGGGPVTIACDGVITITSTKTISANTIINASGHNMTINGNNSFRVFNVASGITFSVTNLTIAYGKNVGTNGANGGNGANQGNTGGNGGTGGVGGSGQGAAVNNAGTSYFVNCTFLTNVVVGGNGGNGGNGGGGGFVNGDGGTGGLGGIGAGGAVYNVGTLVLSNCTFTANSATAGNGGLAGNPGTNSLGGPGKVGEGGSGNQGMGGAVYSVSNAVTTIYGCTFNNNAVLGGNSQTGNPPFSNGNGMTGPAGGAGAGGAIANFATNAIINCTFYLNTAEGGNGGNGGPINPLNGFYGGNGGSGGIGVGGNLYNFGFVGLTNCTFAEGVVIGGTGGAGGAGVSGSFNGSTGAIGGIAGANIYNGGGTFNFKNSLLDLPINTTSAAGTITDQGNNISSDATPTFTATNSFDSLDPQLAALTNYGGPTLTMALQPGSPAIGAGDNNAAPIQDQRGYYWGGISSIGAYEYGGIAAPIVQLFTLGPTASEDGDVGMFYVQRSAIGPSGPLTINFSISGTATNGVNCTTITNSVTIASGGFEAQILVRALSGTFSGTNLSVVLALTTNSQYLVDTNFAAGTVLLYPHSTFDPSVRFVRGTSTAADFQSFVIPLSFQTGVPLAAIGGNATNLFPGNPWTTNFYHYDATNLSMQSGTNGRIAFQNPIVAFGSPVGGSPLYLNHTYQFGMHAGNDYGTYLSTALRIQVYNRTNGAYAGTISLPVPDTTSSSQLTPFATNGFTETTNAFGLTVVWSTDFHQRWGNVFGRNYVLSHVASASATNYYYVIEAQGLCPNDYMVRNSSGNADWSKMYVMEFTPFPASLSTFIDRPHFDGVPLPPQYQGMSPQELTNVAPTLPNLSSLTPSNYLTIDGSPELRRHPILDQFVKNMNNDPLALANYVINEIDLTDAVDYDTNYNSQPAVNLGGVDRGALATFQEGQGSPVEQCALLIYLLRQAGVPAAYVYPTNNGLQMLDSQLSKLLRVQLNGVLSSTAQTNLPQLISVNYPWVAAYIGTNWVQIFPWLKDTEISEGFNLYDYLPTNYNSGFKWMTHFLTNDPNIFSLSTSDQPADLLPLFIQTNLDLNYPGVSVDDLGVQIVNRRHLYARWTDFPLPFALSGTPSVIESLSSNLNLFNTLDILVYSQANPSKAIDTTEMRVMDFHNRKLLLKFVQVGTSNLHNMVLTLSPYSTNITNVAAFATNSDSTWKLTATNQLNSTDDGLVFQITHRRNKFLPSGYAAPAYDQTSNLWNYTYAEFGQQQAGKLYQFQETSFRKGDLLAFCIDAGRVSQKMLNVQAQEIWQFNQAANSTNPPATLDPDIYEGTTAYLLGMSYFNYYDNFEAFNSHLHKIQPVTSYAYGFGMIRPQRDTSGALVSNGVVNLITPGVHIRLDGVGLIFNGTLHPDSGIDYPTAYYDWFIQGNLQGSAAEHGVLRGFYQTNAISTVKLLQQVGTNKVTLTLDNYLSAATNVYNGVQLQNADPTLWPQVTSFFATGDPEEIGFLTPGVVTNGTYAGVGALLLSHNYFLASVSGLNGGIANNFPTTTFTSANAPNLTVLTAPDGSTSPFIFQSSSPVNNSAEPVDGATTADLLSATAANLANGTEIADPNLQQAAGNLSTLLGTANTAAGGFDASYLNQGALSTTVPAYNDGQQLAAEPVNIMTGEFYVDAVDLALPGPLNLQVRRNYGSQNLLENEFGFGWKVNYMPFLSLGTNSVLIYAAEMDGTVVAYRQTGTNANVWLPTTQDNPTLNNNSSLGIGSVANLFNNRLQLSTSTGTNVYTLTGADGSVRTFTQNSFPIGSFSRQRPYLNTWQDNRGNSYTFQYGTNSTQPDWGQLNRVQSANGNFFGFYYDTFGHIIEAYTGDGRILQYDYDKYGDLVTVTLPDESQINYVYQHLNQVTNSVTNLYSTHLILQELKPEGRILQNAYDSQRRVTNQMSTAGADLIPIRTATFAYANNFSLSSPTNQLAGTTAVYDYTNHVTTYTYTNSLIQSIVDPLTQSITQTWYGAATNGGYPRSLKTRTDKRGLVSTYQYDAFGNVTNVTLTGDLTGSGVTTNAVTSAVYNTNNLPLLVTDPVGNATQIIYATNYPFLAAQEIKLAGTNAWCTNLSIYTNVSAVVTNGTLVLTNSAFGLLARSIRAYGSADAASNDFIYNGQGFLTSTIAYTGTSDPPVTNQLFYNERGEMVQRTDAAGRAYTFFYDPMGRLAGQETFDVGQTTPMDWNYLYYNENGELNWIDGPRFNPEDYLFYEYDGAGRKAQQIRWLSQGNIDGSGVSPVPGYGQFATTFYQYDPLGDLVQVTDPLGNYTVQSFDAIGQMLKQVAYAPNGAALATNIFTYEPGGLVASATNALGGANTRLYNSRGQLEFEGKADGSTNGWLYDLSGRVVTEFTRYGSFWQTTYDDTHQQITRVFMSGATALATTIVQLDHHGNVIQRTDADGNVYTNLYDGLDRLKIAAGPAIVTVASSGITPGTGLVTNTVQQIETYVYDDSGQALTVSNALGEKTVTTKDALGRPIKVEVFSAGNSSVRVTTTGYSTDHNSLTVTNGTGTNAIVTTTYTDTEGHPVLNLGYPTNGVIEYSWQQYDADGNRIAKQQLSSSNGVITTWATNGWTYDGLNRVLTETSKDGAVTTFAYDALGDVTNRAMPGGLTWSATYLNDGRMVSEQEQGGSLTTRQNSYTYYGSNSVFAGLLATRLDGRGTLTSNFQYDAFLRLTNLNTYGSAPQQNFERTFSYDPAGNLFQTLEILTAASPNTYPDALVIMFRGYDAYNHVTLERVSVRGAYSGVTTSSQGWNSAGRRANLETGINVNFAYRADGLMTQAGNSSFTYANNGLLASRTTGAKTVTINQRDGRGRVLQTTTALNGSTVLGESLSWRNDGLLNAYTASRDFTDSRGYGYSSLANRLTRESFGLSSGHSATNNYAFDNNATGGLGILTGTSESSGLGTAWSVPATGGLDGVSRVAQEQDSLIRRSTYGTAAGAGTVAATLDGTSLDVEFSPNFGGVSNGVWRADMNLSPGSHALSVSAVDPSGTIFGSSNSTFSVATNAADTIQNTYDGNGNITARTWTNSLGQTNRTQILTWDAFDRLVAVSERDAVSNGFDWSAAYDSLGRRVQTGCLLVRSNIDEPGPEPVGTKVTSYFDPEVEFEEAGVVVGSLYQYGVGFWKTLGPDANGVYGGLQGVGGLESINEDGHFDVTQVVQDYFGNVIGFITNGSSLSWNPARFTSYGLAPGYQSPALSPEVGFAQSLGWRGKRQDETGLYGSGWARTYDPVAGRFLSADPLGHGATMDLYSFCGGDPVNFFDPDGRLDRYFYKGQNPNDYDQYGQSSDYQKMFDTMRFLNGGSQSPLSAQLAQIQMDAANFVPQAGSGGLGTFLANNVLNAPQIQSGWQEMSHPDLSSPLGWATFATATVSTIGNSVGAALNLIPFVGAGKTALATGGKAVVGLFAKDAAMETLEVGGKELAGVAESEINLVNGRVPINSKYAGGTYPLENLSPELQAKYPNSVQFTPQGFPNFSPYAQAEVEVEGLTGIRQTDEALANKAVGLSDTPAGYTWHHVENGTTMQLVPSDIHEAVRHTGGAAVIKGN